MKQVVHILRYFGHPNQEYTTTLLENIQDAASNQKHWVLCDKVFKLSNKIQVLKTKTSSLKPTNWLSLVTVTWFVLTNKDFKQIAKDKSIKYQIKFVFKWWAIIKRKPDVIHVHHLQVVNKMWLHFFSKQSITLIVSLRGMELMRETLTTKRHKAFLDKLSYFNGVHVISQFMYDETLKKGVPKEKLKLIYRGLNTSNIKPENRNNHHVSLKKTDRIRLIAVGRLDWEKGHGQLLIALSRLKAKNWNISLDIFGEGELETFLKLRTKQLNLENEVNFKGYFANSKLKEQYKKYHRAVQPSQFEALSNGLLDMAAHQVPCVIPNIGGMTEIIVHQKNGVIYQPDTKNGLQQALLESFQCDFKNIKDYSKKLANKFSLSNEIKNFLNLYI